MEHCTHCGSEHIVKAGHKNGVQKWKCKNCGKYQGAGDHRLKYTEAEKKAALFLYLEGVGFRQSARILSKMFNKDFCYRTIMQWVQKEAGSTARKARRRNKNFRNG